MGSSLTEKMADGTKLWKEKQNGHMWLRGLNTLKTKIKGAHDVKSFILNGMTLKARALRSHKILSRYNISLLYQAVCGGFPWPLTPHSCSQSINVALLVWPETKKSLSEAMPSNVVHHQAQPRPENPPWVSEATFPPSCRAKLLQRSITRSLSWSFVRSMLLLIKCLGLHPIYFIMLLLYTSGSNCIYCLWCPVTALNCIYLRTLPFLKTT